jgi:hypothetical protein
MEAAADTARHVAQPSRLRSTHWTKTAYILFRCNASRHIRFSFNGDPHERIHRRDLLRQRLHNPRVLGTLVSGSRHPVRPLLHSRVHRLRPSAAGRRTGRRTGRLLRRRSHADSARGRILRLGCPQSHVVRGALRTPWRMRDKTIGAGRRPPPVPPSERFSSWIAVVAALAYCIAGSGNHMLTSGPAGSVARSILVESEER